MHINKHLFIGAALLAATFSSNQIVHSAPRAGKVITKSQIAISSPKNNSSVDSPLTVRGTAPANQQVGVNVTAVFDGGQRNLGTMNTTANKSGHWTTRPIQLLLPKNAKNAQFKIVASYKVGKLTHTSGTVKVRLKQKLVPVQPNIEKKPNFIPAQPRPIPAPVKPRNYVKPDITSPRASLYLSMPNNYPVKGKATPDRDVKVTVIGKWTENGRSKTRQIDQKTVRTASNGKWTAEMRFESVSKKRLVSYDIIAEDPVFHDKDTVTINESIRPTIITPRQDEQWVSNGNYFISGNAGPGQRLNVSITAHWVTMNGNIRRNQTRVIAYDTVNVDSLGNWSTRLKFEPVNSHSSIMEPYYIIVAKDTVTRADAAVTVEERK